VQTATALGLTRTDRLCARRLQPVSYSSIVRGAQWRQSLSMTYPRAHLIDAENGGSYHLHSRCVRRAWLCGTDPDSGQSYEHRKVWLEKRIIELSRWFAVKLVAYAIMSNHYHVVLESYPKDTANWSDEEVAERWDRVSVSNCEERRAKNRADALANPERMAVIRKRLGNLSWFMSYVNEPLARLMNKEDECTGRAWEGRFRSSALLDDPAVLKCMVYVDLNPVRAGITDNVTDAPHTSIKRRWNNSDDAAPLVLLSALGLTLRDYVDLLEWTATLVKQAKNADNYNAPPPRYADFVPAKWHAEVESNRRRYRAYGSPERLRAYAKNAGQRWLKTFPTGPPH
jgi:putative transposase